MIVRRWNPRKGYYERHTVPEGWKARVFCADMNELVNCISCGKEITFGSGYCSRQYHSDLGFGFAECKECYDKFWQEEQDARGNY